MIKSDINLKGLDKALNHLYDKKRYTFLSIFSLLIIIWQWPLLLTTNQLLSGDFDYFTQAYEAVRISILDYHQFPWINAWIGGGVPLYANPQVGVFSIQTLLVLVFGAPMGLKLSVIIYSLIGFWGMFYLLKNNFKINIALSLPLSAVWVTNGFFVAHLVSHYSFSMFLVVPALIYLLVNISKRYYWLYLGIASGLFILSAFHYAVFHGLFILLGTAIYILFKNRSDIKKYILLYLGAGIVFIVLALHRIIYTLQFVLDFPRLFKDSPDGLLVALKSFIIPDNGNFSSFYELIIKPGTKINYTWNEHSVFIGYILFSLIIVLSAVCVLYISRPVKGSGFGFERLSAQKTPLAFLLIFVFFVVLSLGNFSPYSPYALLQHLPAYSGMRVSSRWLIWAVLAGLIFIGLMISALKNDSHKRILTILVILGAAEVYAVGFGNDQFFYRPVAFRDQNSSFQQFEDFDRYNLPYNFEKYKTRASYDRRGEIYSYEATANNLGQSRGYEPLVDTYYAPTARCGVVQGCSFVMSKNANVVSWSPNKIVLKRTNEEPIELNMNPSNYWLVNGEPAFPTARTAEVMQRFIVTNKDETITLSVKPYGLSRFITVAKNKLQKP